MADNERTENIIAFTIFFIIVFLVIGFWNQWWGWFSAEAPNPIVQTSIEGEPVKGQANAPVTIVEFSDFQCPYCKRFYQQTLPPLIREYVKRGQVRIVYKNYPLANHDQAVKAAKAGECAYQQGKFWQYHDKLFEHQNKLSNTSYRRWAEQIGLNLSTFNECMQAETTLDEVRQDKRQGVKAGVSSTPSFIVGQTRESSIVKGEFIVGAEDFVTMEAAIQRARSR